MLFTPCTLGCTCVALRKVTVGAGVFACGCGGEWDVRCGFLCLAQLCQVHALPCLLPLTHSMLCCTHHPSPQNTWRAVVHVKHTGMRVWSGVLSLLGDVLFAE